MNYRWTTIAFAALCLLVMTTGHAFPPSTAKNTRHAQDSAPTFQSQDFSHASEVRRDGKLLLNLDLTPSGQQKAQAINTSNPQEVRFDIKGKVYSFKFRQKITGDKVEIGPFQPSEAESIEAAINR